MGGARFKHLELVDAGTVFPDIRGSQYKVARNFDEIASSAAFRPGQIFSDDLRAVITSGCLYVCSFWQERWLDELTLTGIKSLNIEYMLYLQLNSKLTQVKTLHDAGDDFLKQKLHERTNLFATEFRVVNNLDAFNILEKREDFVVSARESAGGSGTFRVRSFLDYRSAVGQIEAPVIRIENFKTGTSYTHFGFVFEDAVVTLPPQFQAIKELGGQLQYVGAVFGVKRVLSERAYRDMHDITRAVGRALASLGYRGAFGCDYVYSDTDDTVLFMELNPRFVGETFMYSKWMADCFIPLLGHEALLFDPISLHVAAVMFHRMPRELKPHLDEYQCLSKPLHVEDGLVSQMFVNLAEPLAESRRSPITVVNTDQVCLYSSKTIIANPEVPVVLVPELEQLYNRTTPLGRSTTTA